MTRAHMLDECDTIAAIATAAGDAGIGIVRISGSQALSVAESVFRPKGSVRLSAVASHTLHYGWIVDAGAGIIDEALVTVMRAPRTFTREDVVEINCHGGAVPLRAVLEALLSRGCRLAEPGEFTRRAFLNGRIDLAQAEAVADIIRAKTDTALKVAASQLAGTLSRRVKALRSRLLDMTAAVEAQIDFPEDDTDVQWPGVREDLLFVRGQLIELIRQARYGRMLRDGATCVICGCANVGKSSLLNALLKKERSIVTHIAGTTRDVIEEIIDIRGIPVRIMDTAGLLEPRDLIEKKAIARTRSCIRRADLLLVVFDGTRRLNRQDRQLFRLAGKRAIAVINKTDRPQRVQKEQLAGRFSSVVQVSARTLKGIEEMEERIAAFFSGGQAQPQTGEGLVTNLRQTACLRQAEKSVAEALDSLDNKVTADRFCQSLKDALGRLDALCGGDACAEVVDRIFRDFCIGK